MIENIPVIKKRMKEPKIRYVGSITKLSGQTGISQNMLRVWIEGERVPGKDKNGNYDCLAIYNYCLECIAEADDLKDEEKNKKNPLYRKRMAEAQLKEIELEEILRNSIKISDAIELIQSVAQIISSNLSTLPYRISHLAAEKKEEQVKAIILKQVEELVEKINAEIADEEWVSEYETRSTNK